MSDDATRMMPPVNPASPGGQTGTFDRTMVAGSAAQMPGVGMGATQQMPAGASDPFRTQMGGTTTCAVCKSTTPLTESYCGECGFLLTSAVIAENLEIPQEEPAAAELVAEADGQRYKLRAGVNTLGRQGTDVLLNEGTISRVHARITVEGNTITVEDMGSSNGTKVGDLRIGANQPTQATPGQTLRFGNWRAVLQLGGMPASASSGGAAATLMGGNQTVAMPAAGDNRTLVGVPNANASTTGENPTQVYQSGDLNPADAPLADMRNATIVEPAVADGNIVAHLTPTSGPGTAITVTEGSLSIGRRPANSIVISNDAYISGRHAQLETDNTGTYLTDVGSTNGTSVNGQKLTAGERQLLLEGDEVQLGQTTYAFALDYETAPSVPITPIAEEPHTGQWSNPDGSPPGQEFGAINDPVYPPIAPRIQEVYHAVDNEVPNE